MAGPLIQVPFAGGIVEAAKVDGQVWVSVIRCCDELGVAPQNQQIKIKALEEEGLAETTIISITDD